MITHAGAISGSSISSIGSISGASITSTGSISGVGLTCSNMTVTGAGGLSVTYGGATNASISNSGALTCASITTSGTITPGGNTVLTTTYDPFYCAGQVNSSGNVVCSTGRLSFTVTQHAPGYLLDNV